MPSVMNYVFRPHRIVAGIKNLARTEFVELVWLRFGTADLDPVRCLGSNQLDPGDRFQNLKSPDRRASEARLILLHRRSDGCPLA